MKDENIIGQWIESFIRGVFINPGVQYLYEEMKTQEKRKHE